MAVVCYNVEQADSIIERHRKTLADRLVNLGWDLKDMTSQLAELSELEGQRAALLLIKECINSEGGEDAARYAAIDVLARGADDKWSGRGNDINRSFYDGQRTIMALMAKHGLEMFQS